MNVLFFLCGFIAVVFVLFISVYLIISGLPAIQEIGLVEFLFGTLTREVLEETGCHVKPDSIREGFLVHEKTNRQSEEVLVMDSYYYFCEVEDIRDSKEAADASGYAIENFYEGEAETKVCWLPLADMIARNENVKELSQAPWVVRELLVMRELQKNSL